MTGNKTQTVEEQINPETKDTQETKAAGEIARHVFACLEQLQKNALHGVLKGKGDADQEGQQNTPKSVLEPKVLLEKIILQKNGQTGEQKPEDIIRMLYNLATQLVDEKEILPNKILLFSSWPSQELAKILTEAEKPNSESKQDPQLAQGQAMKRYLSQVMKQLDILTQQEKQATKDWSETAKLIVGPVLTHYHLMGMKEMVRTQHGLSSLVRKQTGEKDPMENFVKTCIKSIEDHRYSPPKQELREAGEVDAVKHNAPKILPDLQEVQILSDEKLLLTFGMGFYVERNFITKDGCNPQGFTSTVHKSEVKKKKRVIKAESKQAEKTTTKTLMNSREDEHYRQQQDSFRQSGRGQVRGRGQYPQYHPYRGRGRGGFSPQYQQA